MSLRSWFLLLAVVHAGCACGASEPTDTPSDRGPSVDSNVIPGLHGELTVLSEGCPEWDVVAHPAPMPDPPPSGAPELLWEWAPLEDPLIQLALERGTYRPVAGFSEMRWPALSPDGSVWARGPDAGSLVQVDRSGHALWIQQLDTDRERHYSTEVRIAPDGSALLRRGYPGELIHVRPTVVDGLSLGLTRIPIGDAADRNPGGLGTIAIGPLGRVYVNPQLGTLVATCQGDRVLWQLQLRLGADSLSVLGMFVLPDGRVAVSTSATQPVVVSEDGEVEWLWGVEGRRDWRGRTGSGVGAVADERYLWAFMLDGTSSTLVLSDVLDGSSIDRWALADQTQFDPQHFLDPAGMLWRTEPFAGTPDHYARFDLDVGEWERRGEYCYLAQYGQFTASSDLLCLREDGLLRIRATDGAASLLTTERGEFVDDVDGRIYQIAPHPEGPEMTSTIVAYRTDAVPPRGPYCVMDGCNRHRNNWAHDYGAPP